MGRKLNLGVFTLNGVHMRRSEMGSARKRVRQPEIPADPPEPEELLRRALELIPPDLTCRQRAFALAYSMCLWRASRAARLAGYSPRNPRQSGYQVRLSPRAEKARNAVTKLCVAVICDWRMSYADFSDRYGPAFHRAIAEILASQGVGIGHAAENGSPARPVDGIYKS